MRLIDFRKEVFCGVHKNKKPPLLWKDGFLWRNLYNSSGEKSQASLNNALCFDASLRVSMISYTSRIDNPVSMAIRRWLKGSSGQAWA
jgi:hypothetical protein